MFEFLRKDPPPAPAQLNEHDQVTDEKVLKKDRIKFGLGTVLFQSEETSIGGVPSFIIRMLGGDERHLGLYGSTQGVTSVAQFLGAIILRKFGSDRRSMVFSMMIGFIVAAGIATVILAARIPAFHAYAVYAYLALVVLFFAVGGFQWNIESSWIGDLVPKNRLGWFTSYKWILGTIGVVAFNMVIAKLVDRHPSPAGCAAVYAMFSVSFMAAAAVYSTATDRTPKNAYFFSGGESHQDRIRYASVPLWCYITFYWCWSGGRVMLLAFQFIYLMDQFQFTMTKIAWLNIMQYGVSVVVIYIFGKFIDKRGNRIPLLIVSATVASCMFLWVSSAWWGIVPILIYQLINGAAGNTHSMLAINLALEIFPDKGRAAYLGFSRFCLGLVTMSTPVLAGFFMRHIAGFQMVIHGVTFNKYHILFFTCACISLCCVIPLIVLGKHLAKSNKVNIG